MARDRAEDAAAVGGDVRVAGAGQPAAQLVAPIAGEHDVRVRIDEPGHDGAALGIDDDRVVGQRAVARQLVVDADEDDRAAMASDDRPRDASRRRPGAAPTRGAGPAQVRTSEVLWIRKSATMASA